MKKGPNLHWIVGVLAALAVALLSIIPQVNFWRARGNLGHGSFYSYHPDEYPYAAYVNALVQGRPRRNDPYTGAIDQTNAPLQESIFSIQFVPAYILAIAARATGWSPATVFILLTPISAFASGLIIFCLVARVTQSKYIAATAVLFVLCLGAFARGQSLVYQLGGILTPPIPFPFLRRYQPTLPFPFFFLFCLLLFNIINSTDRRVMYRSAIGAGLTFAVLVFSYYFLWTAALALLMSLIILWTVIRPAGYKKVLRPFGLLSGVCLLTLLPYMMLLLNRPAAVDTYQALVITRTPDLLRTPFLLCTLLLLLLVWASWRRIIDRHDQVVLFTAALATTPLLVFNQQVVTGRSLQPLHYELFIANYVSLLALLLTGTILLRGRIRRNLAALVLIFIQLVALSRGIYEARLASTSRVNITVDEFMPVALRLKNLARAESDSTGRSQVVLVLFPVFQPADALPTVAPQSVLWAPHSFSFSTLTASENKERYFQQLYYSNTEIDKQKDYSYDRIMFRQVVFGWDRVIPGLSTTARPIAPNEEQAALQNYEAYAASFDGERASTPTLSFAITSATATPNFSRIDRWYERDEGERIGEFVLFRLRLRS